LSSLNSCLLVTEVHVPILSKLFLIFLTCGYVGELPKKKL